MTHGSHDLAKALVEEHGVIATWLDDVLELAESALDDAPRTLLGRGRMVVDFLDHEVLPRLAVEETSLYTDVERRLGPAAVAPMRRDHEEVRRLARDLRRYVEATASQLLPSARHELVWLLHSMHAVLSLHLVKEEELYLPLLSAEADLDLVHD